jgi:hypothetical protein
MRDHEVIDPPSGDLIRHPGIPTTLAELALRKGEATEIIEARISVLNTARMAAIRATHPEDWLLFKAKDEQGGQVVGYLQDSGCERVRDIFGISVMNISQPEKIAGAEPAVFHYLVRGDGHCTLTAQTIEGIEGGRSSTEDFCKDKTGAALELAVRKAARANLDGQIVRELTGLAAVPIAELEAAWTGTHKKPERCRRGRGFGSGDERLGAVRQGVPDVEPPVCPHCGTKGAYRPGKDGRGAFYGCPKYQSHADKKWIVDAAKWVAEQQQVMAEQQQAKIAEQPATSTAVRPTTRPVRPAANGPQRNQQMRAEDIFGGGREPGSEG